MDHIPYYHEYMECMKKKDIGNEIKCKDIFIKLLKEGGYAPLDPLRGYAPYTPKK
jgi:hypothetical protein